MNYDTKRRFEVRRVDALQEFELIMWRKDGTMIARVKLSDDLPPLEHNLLLYNIQDLMSSI